jgi:hypothetical protein
MTMVGNRSRVVKPALLVWLLVLVADASAAGGTTLLVYLLAGVVATVVVIAATYALAVYRQAMMPQPVPVRVRRDRR